MAEYEYFKISPDATPNPNTESWKGVGEPKLNKDNEERIKAYEGEKTVSPAQEEKTEQLASKANVGESIQSQVNVSPSSEPKSSDWMKEASAIGEDLKKNGVVMESREEEKTNPQPQPDLNKSMDNQVNTSQASEINSQAEPKAGQQVNENSKSGGAMAELQQMKEINSQSEPTTGQQENSRTSGAMAELQQMKEINSQTQSNIDTSKKNINLNEEQREAESSRQKEDNDLER